MTTYTVYSTDPSARVTSRPLKVRASSAYVAQCYEPSQLEQLRAKLAQYKAQLAGDDDQFWLGKYAANGRNGRGVNEGRIDERLQANILSTQEEIKAVERRIAYANR